MKKQFIFLITIIIACGLILILQSYSDAADSLNVQEEKTVQENIPESQEYVKEISIGQGSTFSKLMEEAGISGSESQAIFEASKEIYDLSSLREGRNLVLTFQKTDNQFISLMYPISSEEELFITKKEKSRDETLTQTETGDQQELIEYAWVAEKKTIEYEIKKKVVPGTILTSLYEAGLKLGIKEGTIIELANAFQWSIDFSYDIQTGDSFVFLYEERYRDGKYIMDGRVLAAQFKNNGREQYAYYFEESESNSGYFDENGNSLQKMFLKAPVAFKYISSGFTTGRRYVQAFSTYTGHRAIDYAASFGTPIQSVGNGTVVSAGWNSQGYGNLTSIRHNATYTTNYAHQSKIIVRPGQSVSQGQVIGYVGSTGFSTGPHLHYEMVKNGVKINPLNEILPPGKPILEENKERFTQVVSEFNEVLWIE